MTYFYITFAAMRNGFKSCIVGCLMLLTSFGGMMAQSSQAQTQLKVKQLIEKKAEYHRLTAGNQDGYRIKIHFDVDRDKARSTRNKFSSRFPEYSIYEEYQQPYWVVFGGRF